MAQCIFICSKSHTNHPPTYLPTAKGVLVVCDLTRENTFEAVKAWKKEIDEWARTEGRPEGSLPVVLIANKVRTSSSIWGVGRG